MPIAKEGLREMAIATIVCAVGTAMAWKFFAPLAGVFAVLWIGVILFFRDPNRRRVFEPGELCAPADGTVTEVSELVHHESLDGPAVRIGIFLSLFNVHVNRSPCAGWIRSVFYHKGEFLDARHPEAGRRNESNTILMEPDGGIPGPVEVRQVAGVIARRIVCSVAANQYVPIGARIGLIKFGSRTELIIPRLPETDIKVRVGDSVRGGLTVLARQPVHRTVARDPETPVQHGAYASTGVTPAEA